MSSLLHTFWIEVVGIDTPKLKPRTASEDAAPAAKKQGPGKIALKKIEIAGVPNYSLPNTSGPLFLQAEYSDKSSENLSNATEDIEWKSSAPGVVHMDPDGHYYALAPGSAKITAKHVPSGLRASTTIKVDARETPLEPKLQKIEIAGVPNYSLPNTSGPFFLQAEYSDKSSENLLNATEDIEWKSSAPGVVHMDPNGRFHALAPGSAKITAKHVQSGLSASTTIKVNAIELLELKLSPENPTLVGATQFTATGVYSAGPDKDLTASVAWSSSAPKVVTIDEKGRATGTGVGTATITAKYQGRSASTKLTLPAPGDGAKSAKV